MRHEQMRLLGCVCVVFTLLTTVAQAQAQRNYALSVTTDNQLTFVSLKAEGARLLDIAADLEKRLRARVVLAPSLQKETISVSIADSLLEPVLMSLAPRVYVDYEIRQDASPVPLGIYLLDVADPVPPSDAVVRGTSLGVVIEGNTEDVGTAPKDDPLLVTGDRRFLTITAKQQPLALVARAIGDVLGIQVELNDDAGEIIDANISAVAEDAITRLSPKMRLYVRAAINYGERTPFRLVVAPPGAK